MKYFDLWIKQEVTDYWHLRLPLQAQGEVGPDVWAFTRCEPYTGQMPVKVEIACQGKQVDFNYSVFGPILSNRCADIFRSICQNEIQLITASIEGSSDNWYILNVLQLLPALNYEESILDYFPANHPRKPGMPRGVRRLVLNHNVVEDHHIFRIRDWNIPIIVSEVLVNALNESNISGIECLRVDTDIGNKDNHSTLQKNPEI